MARGGHCHSICETFPVTGCSRQGDRWTTFLAVVPEPVISNLRDAQRASPLAWHRGAGERGRSWQHTDTPEAPPVAELSTHTHPTLQLLSSCLESPLSADTDPGLGTWPRASNWGRKDGDQYFVVSKHQCAFRGGSICKGLFQDSVGCDAAPILKYSARATSVLRFDSKHTTCVPSGLP